RLRPLLLSASDHRSRRVCLAARGARGGQVRAGRSTMRTLVRAGAGRPARRGWMRVSSLIGPTALLGILLVAPLARAQLGGGASVPPAVKLVRVKATPVQIQAGGKAEATFKLTVERGWHINANPPS